MLILRFQFVMQAEMLSRQLGVLVRVQNFELEICICDKAVVYS